MMNSDTIPLVAGLLDIPNWFSANRHIYSVNGISPTLISGGEGGCGNGRVKILEYEETSPGR